MSHPRHARSAAAGLAALATAAFGTVALSPTASAADSAPAASSQGTDRYIVSFQRGKSAQARAAIRNASGRVVLELPGRAAVAAVVPTGKVSDLRRSGAVGYVEVDRVRTPVSIMPSAAKPDGVGGGKGGGKGKPKPDEPTSPTAPPTASDIADFDGAETLPYGIQTTQANQVSASSNLKKVCIIDSGYYAGHEDLRDPGDGVTGTDDIAKGGRGAGPWNTIYGNHGTHVAGTIAGTDNTTGVIGAFPNAPLHIVRVFGDDENWAYSSTLVAALDDCVANGANVVSMSLGGGRASRTEDRAFASAYSKGVLSIAAAGNDGTTATSYPAGYASVVSVAAVDNTSAPADFSQVNPDVEIAAPGVGVLSTVPSITESSLTSGSTTFPTAGSMEGSAQGSATGTLLDGGTCNTALGFDATGGIVLCQRGEQPFAVKVDNALAEGAVGVVVYNNVDEETLNSTLSGSVDIPVIVLSKAVGENVQSTLLGTTATITNQTTRPANGYEKYDGTSMATPHVSAIAAEIWSNVPGASAAAVRNAINSTAFDLGDAGRDNATGFGLIQAKKALTALGG